MPRFDLIEQDSSDLWELVRAVGIKDLESSERPGVPDEVRCTFVLRDGTQEHQVEIWINDARENEKITALVDGVTVLIEAYTQQEPVMG